MNVLSPFSGLFCLFEIILTEPANIKQRRNYLIYLCPMFKKTLIVFCLVLMTNFWASAHKFYTSLTQVDYNIKTHSAEVIMNLFTEDLEVAVSNFQKRKVKSTDKDFNTLCYKYLDSKFQLRGTKNQLFKNEYVGLEYNRDMVSIYLEIKLNQGLNQSHLKQCALLETFTDQTNIVNLKNGTNKTSLVFRGGAADMQTVNFKL